MTSHASVERSGSTSRGYSARDAILQALDYMESENEELKSINVQIQTQVVELERENEQLRNELLQMKNERQHIRYRVEKIETLNSELHREVQLQTSLVAERSRHIEALEEKHREEQLVNNKQIEDLRNFITQKEESSKRTEREIEALRSRLERTARRNYNDRDIELLHEVDMLKEEKKDLAMDKEQLDKINKQLKNELNNLENLLNAKDAELKNETRRHSVLTKEFNSLLDENNRLKLQLRRRSTNHAQQARLSTPGSEILDESVSEIHESNGTATPKSTAITKQNMSREPSLIINNEVFQPTRDYPFSSKEKFSVTRMPSMTSREPSLIKRGSSFSVRDSKKGGRPTGARLDDRRTPDTLPTLDSATPKQNRK